MKNTLFKIFLFFFVLSSAFAQDVSPEMPFDGSGYIDDLAREHAPDMGEELDKPTLKDLKPVQKIKKKKKNISVGQAQAFQGKTYSTDKGMSLLAILAIVGVVLLIIIGALAYFLVVKKPKFKDEEELEDFDKDVVHKADHIQPAPEKVVDPSSTVVYSKPSIGSDLAVATRIDEMGCNPSGIIVDEDKYFAGGDSFVDEDLKQQ
jgi:hypothetical protein